MSCSKTVCILSLFAILCAVTLPTTASQPSSHTLERQNLSVIREVIMTPIKREFSNPLTNRPEMSRNECNTDVRGFDYAIFRLRWSSL